MKRRALLIADVINYLALQGKLVRARADRGDKLAARFELAYREWHGRKTDVKLQNDLLAVAEEYVARDLYETEAAELRRKELKN
jgi:hypothetical protein